MSVDRPLPFFVLWLIFLVLHREWEERPLTVEIAERMAAHLVSPIDGYLAAAASGLSPEAEVEYLNDIAKQFLSWLEIQKDLPWS